MNYLQVRDLIYKVKKDSKARFDQIDVDGEDVLEEQLPKEGSQVTFCLRLPTSSSVRFHKNLAGLIEIEPRISRGQLPEEYYLIEEDYYTKDIQKPKIIQSLDRVCNLIKSLSGLAHYHDEKPSNGYSRLVFLHPDIASSIKPVELETKVTISIVEAAVDLDPRLAVELNESSAINDPHHSAKVGVFGACLATFIANQPVRNAFNHLVSNWQKFAIEYQRDLSTYLSGFAFHKAKIEVAEAELKIAAEFSKVMNDLTGKLLSIPVSVAALISIPKVNTILEKLLLLFGFSIASFILSKTIANQRRQFERIKNAKDLVIGAIEGKKQSYPEELSDIISKLSYNLKKDERGLETSLKIFNILSWSPLIISFFVIGYLYWEEVHFFIKDYYLCIFNAICEIIYYINIALMHLEKAS